MITYDIITDRGFIYNLSGLGNPRGFENPFLLSFGVLWFRLHNYYANETATSKGWTSDEDLFKFDERIFNQARKMVVGIYQV